MKTIFTLTILFFLMQINCFAESKRFYLKEGTPGLTLTPYGSEYNNYLYIHSGTEGVYVSLVEVDSGKNIIQYLSNSVGITPGTANQTLSINLSISSTFSGLNPGHYLALDFNYYDADVFFVSESLGTLGIQTILPSTLTFTYKTGSDSVSINVNSNVTYIDNILVMDDNALPIAGD